MIDFSAKSSFHCTWKAKELLGNQWVGWSLYLFEHAQFAAGDVDTDFIQRHFDELFPAKQLKPESVIRALMAALLSDSKAAFVSSGLDTFSPFDSEAGARPNHYLSKTVGLIHGETTVQPKVIFVGPNKFNVVHEGHTYNVDARLFPSVDDANVTGTLTDFFTDTIHLNQAVR